MAFTVCLGVDQPRFRGSVVTLAAILGSADLASLSASTWCPPPGPLYTFQMPPQAQQSVGLGAGLGLESWSGWARSRTVGGSQVKRALSAKLRDLNMAVTVLPAPSLRGLTRS